MRVLYLFAVCLALVSRSLDVGSVVGWCASGGCAVLMVCLFWQCLVDVSPLFGHCLVCFFAGA